VTKIERNAADGLLAKPPETEKGISPHDKIPFQKQLEILLHAVTLLETLHATGGIDQFLLSGEKRMAGRADFGRYLRLGRASLEAVAAETLHSHFIVLGVYSFFHFGPPQRPNLYLSGI
jgi:hypothetical protein